jgi:SAM-dependent methyltransferase
MSAAERYDHIGAGCASVRRLDPRWVARIHHALAGHRTLVNVGAGAGSYEPTFMSVVGVEPSQVMIRQRSAAAAPVVCGVAEQLPFPDGAFDVALAVFSVHHWADPGAGLAELRRVARKQVVVTWDPEVFARQFWLVRDYLPEAVARETYLATLATVVAHLGPATTERLQVPEDCTDGFFGAYWKLPRCDCAGSNLWARAPRPGCCGCCHEAVAGRSRPWAVARPIRGVHGAVRNRPEVSARGG